MGGNYTYPYPYTVLPASAIPTGQETPVPPIPQ
jgi:hypothetical protein